MAADVVGQAGTDVLATANVARGGRGLEDRTRPMTIFGEIAPKRALTANGRFGATLPFGNESGSDAGWPRAVVWN